MDLHYDEFEIQNTLAKRPWVEWEPTIDSDAGGTPNVTKIDARYVQVGKIVFFHLEYNMDDPDSASGAFLFTLPVACAEPNGTIMGVGRETVTTGKMLFASFVSPTGRLVAHDSVNDGVFVTGYRLVCSGSYRTS